MFLNAGTWIAEIGAWDHGDPNSGLSIDVGTYNQCIYITSSNGYVGIGGIAPQFPLDVNGAINCTELYVNGVKIY
jgi:hypothetical protein